MSTVVVERQEWEQVIQETERLVKNHEKLLGKVKDLEEAKRILEERLATSQKQQQELQETLNTGQRQQQELQQKLASFERQSEIDAKGVSTIKELRSNVIRLLKDSERIEIG